MNKKSNFTFIDLFAGIGGIRIGFENAGGKCVFSSEYDKFAQITYEAFFGERPDFSSIKEVEEIDPPGDITQFPPELVPEHDILTGGFPCQPFSLAGVSKKNSLGRPHGFDDPTQGTLFFNIKKIIDKKRPKAFMLENVKNLRSHDKGRTYKVIRETLENLNYTVFDNIIDGQYWVPQHRERIYIIGFRNPGSYQDEEQNWKVERFQEFTEMEMPEKRECELRDILNPDPPKISMLPPGTWRVLQDHKAHHESLGHGFGYGLIRAGKDEVTRTLSARYHKDGAEILIEMRDKGWERPRRLTPGECYRLMGFPKDKSYSMFFSEERYVNNDMPVSRTQAYKQFGNSVVVPVIRVLAELIKNKLIEKSAI